MTARALLADIDNTLFDWPAFFAPSFRAMVHALEGKLNLPFETLINEFREVYGDKDSLEFSFSIQELASVKGLSKEDRDELIRAGRGAFRRVSKLRLQPYPGVISGLRWLHGQNYLVICVTNSPAYLAQKRLYDLGIDKYVDILVAWEGVDLAESERSRYNPNRSLRDRSRVKEVRTFPKRNAKPNPTPFEIAMETHNIAPENAWAIGDSLQKDLAPAATLGIKTIWARYGAAFDASSKDSRTLLSITNWTDEEIKLTHTTMSFIPDFTIDQFSEIQDILPESQPDLFRT